MPIEVLCINQSYSKEWLEYFARYNIQYPLKDKIYSIRKIVLHTKGDIGLLLNEIVNSETPKVSPVTQFKGKGEQDFSIKRFTTLKGGKLDKEILNILEEELKNLEPVLISRENKEL